MLLKSHASLTCFRACFLPGPAKDLSAPWYMQLVKAVYNSYCCYLHTQSVSGTEYVLGDCGLTSDNIRDSATATTCRLALQPTQPLVKFVATVILMGLNIHSTKLTIHINSAASCRTLSTSAVCTLLARCLCKGVLYLHLLTLLKEKRKNRVK